MSPENACAKGHSPCKGPGAEPCLAIGGTMGRPVCLEQAGRRGEKRGQGGDRHGSSCRAVRASGMMWAFTQEGGSPGGLWAEEAWI